ncbi:MAG: DUF4097 family beta strand repeat-containing protein [Clostridiaceae bacterium]
MGKFGKAVLILTLILGIVFFYLGINSANTSGITIQKIVETVSANLREMNLNYSSNEYTEIGKTETIETTPDLKKIIIETSVADLNIKRGNTSNFVFDIKGNVLKLNSENLYSIDSKNSEIKLEVAKFNSIRPSISGINVEITLPVGFTGKLEVKSTSGSIFIDSDSQYMDLTSVSGDISVESIATTAIKSVSTSGNININGYELDVDTKSTSGDVSITGEIFKGNIKTTSGDIILRGNVISDKMKITSVSGKVEISVSGGYDFKATSTSGYISYDGKNAEKEASGKIWGGGKEIIIETTSGDIYLQ